VVNTGCLVERGQWDPSRPVPGPYL
jgi:hypothetical protein